MTREEHPQSSLFWISFIVLGLLHLLFGRLPTSALRLPYSVSEAMKQRQAGAPIEVEKFVDTQKPVVESSRAKNDPSAAEKEARFAGEFKNRVEKEVRSPRTGRFAEGGAGRRGSPSVSVPRTEQDGEGSQSARSGNLGMSDLLPFGASPNRLPDDIGEGNETVLNTDPVRYAGFINRIAEEIYEPWVQHAREAIRSLYQAGKKLESNTYITKIQVVMDDRGEVKAIQTLGTSGVSELDDAPKKAFWEVEPFPNPPSQMFEKDGLVRFVYEFHFEWKTSSFNIVPWQI